MITSSSCSPSYRFIFLFSLVLSVRFASSASSLCPQESDVFLNHLQSRCPLGFSSNPPIEVDGEFLDRALTSKHRNAYISMFFYASWCPFSRSVRLTFETLSSMFPQMEHYTIEQSSALPSIFSRYGIHSLPSILLVNQTSRLLYRGQKDLQSLIQFYEKNTGLAAVEYFTENELISLDGSDGFIMYPWNASSMREIIRKEPYLVFAVLFLCLRVLIYIFPGVLALMKDIRGSYLPHLNLEIFGETSQLFVRALHMVDVRRVWTKLRIYQTRNFHEGAKNARVWASSLASVALGESSSSRISS